MTLFLATVASYGEEAGKESSENTDNVFVKEQTIEMYDFNNFNVFDYNDTLKISTEQMEIVDSIMKEFNKNMVDSFNSKKRKKKALKSINKNIQLMCNELDNYQYHMYLRILNQEFNRRGIDLY